MNFSSHTAGIASGAKFLKSGINNIILLEAEDRTGGRIHTDRTMLTQTLNVVMEENNIVYEMVDAESVFSKTDDDIGKMSFIRSNGTSVDGRLCEHLLNLCTHLCEVSRAELANYQGSIGRFLVKKNPNTIQQPDFDGIDSELATQIMDI